ncbi:hypothetical protein SpCBS45565_g04455 [Spizellomyces sp. 'palustris']|nr:hypothetical protein SpCBS45565_g04455 [Spizellomyces sp. 'palustris']
MDPGVQSAITEGYNALHKVPISTLLRHRRYRKGTSGLISVPEDTTLGEVMSLLRTEGILAVPVYKEVEGDTFGKEYTGIVSIYDILAFTVFQKIFDQMDPGSSELVGDDADTLKDFIDSIVEGQQIYFNTPVSELVGLSRESQESWTLNSSSPISSLLQMLTTAAYHRVLVIDEDALAASAMGDDDGPGPTAPPAGSSITMVTQTDLLYFLMEHTDIAPKLMATILNLPAQTVDELAARRAKEGDANQVSGNRKHISRVVTVPDSVTALEAFRVMYTHGVTAVPVIDKDGGLAANLSASDLRGISTTNLECLLDNVYTFLEVDTRRRADQVKADQLKFVEPEATLQQVVNLMLGSHVHRVWIAGEGDKPIGVVTFSDVLSTLVPDGMMAVEQ